MSIKDMPADARPREKILARGPHALSDVELLAIVLRTGMAGKNVFQLSAELLLPNGVAGLLQASAQSLKLTKGLGPAKQAELLAVFELARRALGQQLQQREVFHTPGAIKHYLQLQLAHKNHEVFAVLFLDNQNRLLATEELFRGTLSQTSVYPREVVMRALHHQAAAVVLSHNHPSGEPEPSVEDLRATRVLANACTVVGVRLHDHIVVAGAAWVSLRARGDLGA